MAETPSTMLALGTWAPDFQLPDVVSGRLVSRDEFQSEKALLVVFVARHCPYVRHVQQELARIGRDYAARGVAIVAISSNDVATHPGDRPESLREWAVENDFLFPVCYDETQRAARAYAAACTPDFFLFDQSRRLVYRGQLDGSRPSHATPVTGEDLRAALDAVLEDREVSAEQRPSVGCNIKWKRGHEPDYARR